MTYREEYARIQSECSQQLGISRSWERRGVGEGESCAVFFLGREAQPQRALLHSTLMPREEHFSGAPHLLHLLQFIMLSLWSGGGCWRGVWWGQLGTGRVEQGPVLLDTVHGSLD